MKAHDQVSRRRGTTPVQTPPVSAADESWDLEEHLLVEHSRVNTDRIVCWIGADASRLARLMKVFLGKDPLLTQRAAWVVGVLGDAHPVLLEPWIPKMLAKMREPGAHDAVRRNVVRVLQFVDVPQRLLGRVAAVCFDELTAGGSPAAVKASAMTVLARIARREPELAREVRLVIEQQLPYGPGSFRARARKVLREL